MDFKEHVCTNGSQHNCSLCWPILNKLVYNSMGDTFPSDNYLAFIPTCIGSCKSINDFEYTICS